MKNAQIVTFKINPMYLQVISLHYKDFTFNLDQCIISNLYSIVLNSQNFNAIPKPRIPLYTCVHHGSSSTWCRPPGMRQVTGFAFRWPGDRSWAGLGTPHGKESTAARPFRSWWDGPVGEYPAYRCYGPIANTHRPINRCDIKSRLHAAVQMAPSTSDSEQHPWRDWTSAQLRSDLICGRSLWSGVSFFFLNVCQVRWAWTRHRERWNALEERDCYIPITWSSQIIRP